MMQKIITTAVRHILLLSIIVAGTVFTTPAQATSEAIPSPDLAVMTTKLIPDTWSALTDNGLSSTVIAFSAIGNDLYVGGTFNQTSGGATTGLNNIAKYNTANGTWSALTDNGLNGLVRAIVVVGTDIYVGGDFTQTFGGATTGLNRIAKYDTTTETWSALTDNGVNNNVFALAILGEDMYVGGVFTQSAGGASTGLNNIAKYNTTTGVWSPLTDNGLNNSAITMAVIGNDLYLGGSFVRTFGSATTGLSRIAKYDTINETWSGLTDDGLDNNVLALAAVGNELYAGGFSTETFGGATTGLNSIAKYDTTTETWSALTDNGLDNVVRSLAVLGSDLYIGGDFTETFDGTTTNLNKILKYDTTTETWSPLADNGLNNTVNAMIPVGDNLYVGGSFTQTFGGVTTGLDRIAQYRATDEIVVTTAIDTTGNNGLCSLREAIINANNDNQTGSTDCFAGFGADTITFAGNYTITLTGAQLPLIVSTMTISGNGADKTILQASTCNPVTLPMGCTPATYRVLEVGADADLTINGLTVRHGVCDGGGVCSTDIISGGGIYNGDMLTIVNSVISDNVAGLGGGIFIDDGGARLSMHNSTINSNSAGVGGGINNRYSAYIVNSTFSQNSADFEGGGLFNEGTVTLFNVTMSQNFGQFNGGGISNAGTLHFSNTIVANSTSGGDCINSETILTNTNNLVEDNTCSPDLSGDPMLGLLANNGGLTQTHALLSGSPAIDAGDDTTCNDDVGTNNLDQRGVMRPQGTSCDIGAYEKLDSASFPTFADVPIPAFAWAHIESIYYAGITNGCSTLPLNYCPNGTVTRAQMAVFLLKGIHGSSYTPPAATGTVFNDVASDSFAAAWIEQFAAEGITGGCGGGNFCPGGLVTRAQMAVFLLKAKHGSSYTPPAATGTVFDDVASDSFAAAWIEQFAAEGITGGCGGGNYCPANSVTRAQMAVFLQKTFALPLP